MNRRTFFKVSSLIPAGFSVISDFKYNQDYSLKIESIEKQSEWGTNYTLHKLSKGSISTDLHSYALQDLRDCHGLCAADELAFLAIVNLEYNNNFTFCDYRTPSSDIKQKQVLKLTTQEKARIYILCRELRGPHYCCRHGYKWGQ